MGARGLSLIINPRRNQSGLPTASLFHGAYISVVRRTLSNSRYLCTSARIGFPSWRSPWTLCSSPEKCFHHATDQRAGGDRVAGAGVLRDAPGRRTGAPLEAQDQAEEAGQAGHRGQGAQAQDHPAATAHPDPDQVRPVPCSVLRVH
ncbi:unnamed protein product, partial [Ixodes persulcatus]